jgi:hypothetical protein
MKRNAIGITLCLAAAIPAAGCQSAGGRNWQFNVDAYAPQVTAIAKAATVNLLRNAKADKIAIVGAAAGTVSAALGNDIKLDPNLAQSQIRALIEKSAPAVAADKGVMSIVEVAVSVAVGQVEHIARKYGPKFDQSAITVKLVRAALAGVKEGADALLLPGGPPSIPG